MAKVEKAEKKQDVVINDFGINIRVVDRSRMDLSRWRQALLSAESILMPVRKLLYDLYEDTILDEHLSSVMDQRRLALTNTKLVFKLNGEIVEPIQKLIDTSGFENLITHLHDSKYFGYSLVRANFRSVNELGEPEPEVDLVPRAHVVPSRTLVVPDPYNLTGENYAMPPYTHEYVAAGQAKDLGLLLKAAPLVLLKRGDVSDWATFNEIFGQPVRVAYYQTGDPAQKSQLEQAMSQAGALAYLVLPEGSRVDFPAVDKKGASDTYEALQRMLDGGMSKLIVGQTMTTENGSSKSQGEVHERVADKIARSDRRHLLKLLNSRVKALLAAQGFGVDGQFEFEEEQEKLSETDQITNAINIHTKVAPIALDWFTEKFGYPFDEEAIKKREEAAQAALKAPVNEEEEKPTDKKPKPGKKKELAAPAGSLRGMLNELRSFFSPAPTR